MAHFSYSLSLSLVHSLWQAALLLLLYGGIELFIKRTDPVHKRNILFILLATQVFFTISTFSIYYSGTPFLYLEYIDSNLSALFSQSYLERLAPWLTGAYIFMVFYKTLHLAVNWHRSRITRKTQWLKPSIDLKLFTQVKANEFGIKRKVKLWYSHVISTPLTFGFFKPVILLPVALVNNLTVAETETLIIHELTHIRCNDYFLNWLLLVTENLFFFNPFISIIAGRIKLEREKNCDTQVLQFNYTALNYAETLLKTARFKTNPAPFMLAAVFTNTQLVRRIRFFTESNNLRFHKRNYSTIAVIPMIGLFVMNIFLVDIIRNKKIVMPELPRKIHLGNVEGDHTNTRYQAGILPVKNVEPVIAVNNKEALSTERMAGTIQLQAIVVTPEPDPVIVSTEPSPENLIIPVLATEEQNDTKEMILKEENSATGTAVTKAYEMKLVNGKWEATLIWSMTEKRAVPDSLVCLKQAASPTFYKESQ